MPSAATTKKERGCFQCSRRRIFCDRTEPSCFKCAKKGIECSGLGRIRFAEGVARRGRLKDCKIPKIDGDDDSQELPTTTGFQAIRWPGEERAKKRRKVGFEESLAMKNPPTPLLPPLRDFAETIPRLPSVTLDKVDDQDEEVEEIGRGHDMLVTTQSRPFNIAPWIAPIDPKLRMLFSHCKSLNVSKPPVTDPI